MKDVFVYIGDSQMPVCGKIIEDNGKSLKVVVRGTAQRNWSSPIDAYRDESGDIRYDPPPLFENRTTIEQLTSVWFCHFCRRNNYGVRDKCKKCNRKRTVAEAGPEEKSIKIKVSVIKRVVLRKGSGRNLLR